MPLQISRWMPYCEVFCAKNGEFIYMTIIITVFILPNY